MTEGDRMRWASWIVTVVTLIGVAWLGFAPTYAGLSNWIPPLECDAVLAPIEGASLVDNLTPQQTDAAKQWLESVGYIEDEGEYWSAEERTAIPGNVQALCSQAQQTRATWMTLVAVFGTGLALAASLRRRTTAPRAPVKVSEPV